MTGAPAETRPSGTEPGTDEWATAAMLKVCGWGFLAATVVFLPLPQIDLWVAEIFYNGGNDFWLRKTLFNVIKNDYLRPAVGITAVAGLLYYFYRRLSDPVYRVKELARYGFFILCVAISTGLIVHAVLKDNWGRARPKQVVEFDGEKQFTPPLLPAEQCPRNCSFVSGDASLGFATLALALYATRRRKMWILISVGAGLTLGALRMMNGSHFLSDVIYSGLITCGTVLLLYRWVVEDRWRQDTAGLRRRLEPLWTTGRTTLDDWASPQMRGRWNRARTRIRRLFRKLGG